MTEPAATEAPQPVQEPAVAYCPWCSAALPAGATDRCPTCGAHLIDPRYVDGSVSASLAKPSDGGTVTTDFAIDDIALDLSPEEFGEAVAPPSPEVRHEMEELVQGHEDA